MIKENHKKFSYQTIVLDQVLAYIDFQLSSVETPYDENLTKVTALHDSGCAKSS